MRTLKICLVMTFFQAALTPAISTRVAALTATLAQNKTSKEKSGGYKDAAQSKQGHPVDASQYVGGESCAECHAAEATHYALTAHNKTNVGDASVDTRSKKKSERKFPGNVVCLQQTSVKKAKKGPLALATSADTKGAPCFRPLLSICTQ
jgi:hypothetical protein